MSKEVVEKLFDFAFASSKKSLHSIFCIFWNLILWSVTRN